MSNKNEVYEAVLSPSVIDKCSEMTRAFLEKHKIPKRDIMRFAMTIEEILLNSAEKAQAETKIILSTGVKFFHPYISLEIQGDAFNAFSKLDEEQDVLSSSILKNLGISPEYSYNNNVNTYYFRIKVQSKNPFVPLVAALLSAAVIGLLGFHLPDSFRSGIVEGLPTPLHDTFLNVLGCVAGPMIFLSVAWGIYGIGDAATLRRIGIKCFLAIFPPSTSLRFL